LLTAHVAEALVLAINALAGGPVTGRPLDFAITTGDNADNTQWNELRWQIDLLDGGRVIRPDSGDYTRWEGVGGSDDQDTHYWHPDGTPLFGTVDQARGTYGFPTVPGLLTQCRAPFSSTGIGVPWYSVFGNHDGLVQGNAPSLGLLGAIATGNLKVTGLPVGVDVSALLAAVAQGDPLALQTLLTLGPAKWVTADANRRLLTHRQTIAEHFVSTGTPLGHGYTQNNLDTDTAYYSFDRGGVHCISLDTCDQTGYSDGSIDRTQFNWLKAELLANSSRYLDTTGQWATGGGPDKLIVLFSHHTVATMTNPIGVDRVLGPEVLALLLQFPNVVLWVNGHTHRNSVTPHPRAATAAVGGGLWEMNTASHVDWPQQARIVELVDNGDGTLSIFGTIIDHAAPAGWQGSLSPVNHLAALSRELGMNDWQRPAAAGATDGRRGTPFDRNVELLVRKPF
jgi:metallophosphoesterase (TIGR03767 family)